MSAFAEDATYEDLLDEDEPVEDLTGDEVFAPPPGPSTMASGGGNTETRFLVVDPVVDGVTYNKDGKVTKPRVEAVMRTHNTLIDADPAEARGGSDRKSTRTRRSTARRRCFSSPRTRCM